MQRVAPTILVPRHGAATLGQHHELWSHVCSEVVLRHTQERAGPDSHAPIPALGPKAVRQLLQALIERVRSD